MSNRVVDANTPPTEHGRWERGYSPWHADAFPEEFKSRAPEQGVRGTGWHELDWCGNFINWVPDGTIVKNGG